MKKLTSLLLAGMLCFVGLGLTGCGQAQESSVVEAGGENLETAVSSDEQVDAYAAEMAKAQQGQ